MYNKHLEAIKKSKKTSLGVLQKTLKNDFYTLHRGETCNYIKVDNKYLFYKYIKPLRVTVIISIVNTQNFNLKTIIA